MVYILRALDADGNRYFYTGHSGIYWLSPKIEQAFAFDSYEAAQRKAMSFNRMEPVHGYWFITYREKVS